MLDGTDQGLAFKKIEGDGSAYPNGSQLSPRQILLNKLWSVFRGLQYANCRYDWDGREVTNTLEEEGIVTAGIVPAGFQKVGRSFPNKYRKPTAPYGLVRAIVTRFTDFLFGEGRRPQFRVPGNADTQDWLETVAKTGKLWSTFMQARDFGGAMGTAVAGFIIVDGLILFEAHDPRWCFPTFTGRTGLWNELKQLEIKYQFTREIWNRENRTWDEVPFWYRRLITMTADTVFEEIEVDEDDSIEPRWTVKESVEHNFGFVPVQWIENLPLQGDIDGDADCPVEVYDMVRAIDALLAQANRGVIANCDPTVVIADEGDISEVAKGSDNAIKVGAGGNVKYIEITGTGPKAAMELAQSLRALALETAQCVLDNPNIKDRATATEIVHVFSSMISKVGRNREQYGDTGILPLMQKVVKGAQKVTKVEVIDAEGNRVRMVLKLPPKIVTDDEGNVKSTSERKVPEGDLYAELDWPRYFKPTMEETRAAVEATAGARVAKLIDRRTAIDFLVEFLGIKDVKKVEELLDEEEAKAIERMQEDLLEGYGAAETDIPGVDDLALQKKAGMDGKGVEDTTV